tara:strand:- start:102 stop:326 length:225 start_codon:yes stop_codon:yes gene_type:complete
MAVKYSKVRDFGAKNRKTRKMGKKIWTKSKSFKFKTDAKNYAKSVRKRGKLARVLTQPETRATNKRYIVYTHTK